MPVLRKESIAADMMRSRKQQGSTAIATQRFEESNVPCFGDEAKGVGRLDKLIRKNTYGAQITSNPSTPNN